MDFDEIFGDYARLLYKYVLKLSHNEDVAEDREAATAVESALKELPENVRELFDTNSSLKVYTKNLRKNHISEFLRRFFVHFLMGISMN